MVCWAKVFIAQLLTSAENLCNLVYGDTPREHFYYAGIWSGEYKAHNHSCHGNLVSCEFHSNLLLRFSLFCSFVFKLLLKVSFKKNTDQKRTKIIDAMSKIIQDTLLKRRVKKYSTTCWSFEKKIQRLEQIHFHVIPLIFAFLHLYFFCFCFYSCQFHIGCKISGLIDYQKLFSFFFFLMGKESHR